MTKKELDKLGLDSQEDFEEMIKLTSKFFTPKLKKHLKNLTDNDIIIYKLTMSKDKDLQQYGIGLIKNGNAYLGKILEKELEDSDNIRGNDLDVCYTKDYFLVYFRYHKIYDNIENILKDGIYTDTLLNFNDLNSSPFFINNLPKHILLWIHYIQLERIKTNKNKELINSLK